MIRPVRLNPRPQMARKAAIREGLLDLPSMKGLPRLESLRLERAAVVDPEMTPIGLIAFEEIAGEKFNYFETPRHHPALVWLARNRPDLFKYDDILFAVPGGVYRIRREGKWEHVETPEEGFDDVKPWIRIVENGAGRPYRRNTYHFHDVRWKERLHQSRCRQTIEDAYRVLSSASAARLDAVPDGEYAFQICGEPGLEGDYIIGEVKNGKVVVFKTLYVSGDSKMIPSWATPVIRYDCVKPLTQGGEVWAHGSVNALEGCSERDAQVDAIVYGALRSSRFGLSPTEVAELTRAVTRSEAAMALRRMFFLRKVDHMGRYHKSNEPRFDMSRR